jgi:aryl-alcohol dehydrogenase-like predicted oxidoreductase
MLNTGFRFDAAQMPSNPFDATFRSFQKHVIPECHRRGMAVLEMKPLSGAAPAVKAGVVTAEECLRHAMSLPVTTTITGMEKLDILEKNLKLAQGFAPMSSGDMTHLEQRVS